MVAMGNNRIDMKRNKPQCQHYPDCDSYPCPECIVESPHMLDHEHDHVPHFVPATPHPAMTRWESFSFGFCMGMLIAAALFCYLAGVQ